MNKLLPAVSLALLAISLTGCSGSTPAQVTSSAVVSASPTAVPQTPSASASATPAASTASIPTDCSALIASTPFIDSFGVWPLNDPAVVGAPGSQYSFPAGSITPTPAASGATLAQTLYAATQLRCVWREPTADITNMTIEVATVDPAIANAYLGSLPAKGYTCAPEGSGQVCQLVTTDPKYNVEVVDTAFLRDDVYLHVSQANVSTPDLLTTLEAKIWG
ncbi:hypothetical protein KPL76_07480 [Subtercola sp. PAMC28395]|uniref:hypothetical protein n=1 Tax=Subtercola sp. PAMC28395 TaxID=2846775 RepID=UPI001C0CDEC7|nr:hypothetical protein [Subtercola sp. PAMC28395]QWT22660.1 hypothetical protein KPL76_07480 [Subtercola sp. PAMC28395]